MNSDSSFGRKRLLHDTKRRLFLFPGGTANEENFPVKGEKVITPVVDGDPSHVIGHEKGISAHLKDGAC